MPALVPVPAANLIPGHNYIIKQNYTNIIGSGTFVSHYSDSNRMPLFTELSDNLRIPGVPDPTVLAPSVHEYFDSQIGGKRRRRAASRRKRSRSRSRRNRR